MRSYHLNVLGLDVSFKAEADSARVERAKQLVEKRFDELNFPGNQISKEKLLTFLVLGLADDLIQSDRKLEQQTSKLEQLLEKIEGKTDSA